MHTENCYSSLGTCWWVIEKLASFRACIIDHSILPPRFFRKPLSFSTDLRTHFLLPDPAWHSWGRSFPLPGQRLLLHYLPHPHPQAALCLSLLTSVSALLFEKLHPSGSEILKQTRSPGLLFQLSPIPLATSVLFLPILPVTVKHYEALLLPQKHTPRSWMLFLCSSGFLGHQ